MSEAIPTRLTFIRKSDRQGYAWYQCACGTVKEVRSRSLKNNHTVSCGCYCKEKLRIRNLKHGANRRGFIDYTYVSWIGICGRGCNPTDKYYSRYGGRGITVCEWWKGEDGFIHFLADMGVRPKSRSIDRIDNDKGYWCGKAECPECGPLGRKPNCRWVTTAEQNRNKRNNRWLTYNGKTQCLVDWADEIGLKAVTIQQRLRRGWSVENALSTPVLPRS